MVRDSATPRFAPDTGALPGSVTAAPAALLEPGLPSLAPGQQRVKVRPGMPLVVDLEAGDTLSITDPEGAQPAEVAALSAAGLDALASLGLLADRAAQFTTIPGFAPAHAALVLDAAGTPGQQVVLTAASAARVAVAPATPPMEPGAQDPPTALLVVVARAVIPAEPPLPAPLGRVVAEYRVPHSTALAYTVKAGEFIQVIDVAGRQCSDFLAFDAAALARGVERGMDMTATRTLTASAYPGPGLFSKFFDQDLNPLVEVVQDTVGRHDSFALACTDRYYDDAGYPGHVSCSDNFNRVLAPHGVAPRGGWPAINFFYNTILDHSMRIGLDEPWSRPGDYVLMRAMTDLVCASSACPDDIDAANGWNPTDIHVRVYAADQTFPKAIAVRPTPDAEPDLTQETGFHARTSALTRRMVEYKGYWLPSSYTDFGPVAEYQACRTAAVIMDLSPLRKFEVTGPDAEALLQYALTRDVRKLTPGQVVYSAMCYPHGGMVDDGTLFKLGPDNFRWIGGDDYGGTWLRQLAAEKGFRAWIRSSTSQLHNVAVQGPKSREILNQIVWTPPAQPALMELQWFRFTIGRIGGYTGIPVVVSRTGYSGELGYEIFCHPRHAAAVWDAVWEAGRPHGLAPLGLDALDMVRIEAGLIFAGYEFDDQTDPFEAGIGFTVALKSEDDFVGKAALIRRKASPQRMLVGLELAGNEVAGHGDCVHVGRAQVGLVTSGLRSPTLRKSLALARVAVEHAGPGTVLEVGKLDGHQKRLPATVVRFPFYDPDKTRPRS
ncbi:DUF1989 domain-containing protein [Zavarzinia sp. CC-PAN008]|uniref:DUF1989 domain-containing protein n=1 Tax=Zavarzinia sp. CC-PAN008 TaxID=3243332 RepID=UPI003F747E2D